MGKREIYDLPKPGFKLYSKPVKSKKARTRKPDSRAVSDDPNSEYTVALPGFISTPTAFGSSGSIPFDRTQEQIDMMWKYKQLLGQSE